MKKVEVRTVASYRGHSLQDNGTVRLNFKFKYDELSNSVQLIQMLNNDVTVAVRLPEESPKKIGMFRIQKFSVDSDGESVVNLNGLNDYIEVDRLNDLVSKEPFQVRFMAEIEEEEGESNDED